MDYPTPAELIEYLSRDDIEKGVASFQESFGSKKKCCLGHYADMCGMTYRNTQTLFAIESKHTAESESVKLPAEHWLFWGSPLEEGSKFDTVQGVLADANDRNQTFHEVIGILKLVQAQYDSV